MKMHEAVTVAVADGERLNLFENSGDEGSPRLTALPDAPISSDNRGSGAHHQSSSANPFESQMAKDSFAAGTAAFLNKQALDGKIKNLIVIAAPRTLGELRKHYHKALSTILVGEIAKDLSGHTLPDVERTIIAA